MSEVLEQLVWPDALGETPQGVAASGPESSARPPFVSALAVLKPVFTLLKALFLRGSAAMTAGRVGGRVRRLKVLETVPLGEKRFVAIVQVQGEQFLIGGGASGVCLLTSLKGEPGFTSVFARQAAQPASVSTLAAGGAEGKGQ